MFRALLGLSLSLCSYEFYHSPPVRFREIDIEPGESVCLSQLPPYTSVLFNQLPSSFFYVNYHNSNSSASAVGTSLTTGFYTGNSQANLTISTNDGGSFFYFVVSFPHDCSERILSNTLPDTIKRVNTTSKICYFNGARRELSYAISVRAKPSGLLEFPVLDEPLTDEANVSLKFVDSSIVSWSGQMDSVTITVSGKPHNSHNVTGLIISGTPTFLEADPIIITERGVRPISIILNLILLGLFLLALRVSCVRRKMRQRERREDEAIPVIETNHDPQQIPSQYIYVPVTCRYTIDPLNEPLNCEE